MSKLGWNSRIGTRNSASTSHSYKQPKYDAAELCGVVPVDYRVPYDCHEVIARIVDDSDFLDFKESWGADTICGHASIAGQA
ncbi:carboxyl transferase domain-containing protein, partial [Acinetobacter baumannii]